MTNTSCKVPFEIQGEDFKSYRFDAETLKEFKIVGDGSISLSNQVYAVESGNSLCWEWDDAGAEIVYSNPEAFKNLTGQKPDDIVYDWVTCCPLSTFSLWIFSSEFRNDKLKFEIGTESETQCSFYMNLNFRGWRELKALYGRDMDGFPDPKTADTLRIIAPKQKGKLFIDQFAPRKELDVRFFMPTKQTPWVKGKKKFRPDIDCDVKGRIYLDSILPGYEILEIEKLDSLSDAQEHILENLDQKAFRNFPIPNQEELGSNTISNLKKDYKKHDIRFYEDLVSGKVGKVKKFWIEAAKLAIAFKKSSNDKLREELLAMFNSMMDLVIQIGHGSGYCLEAAFIYPIWLMKGELKKSGRFDKIIEIEKKLNGVDRFYLKDDHGTADNFNTLIKARLLTILLQDNTPVKWRDLTALKLWLDRSAENGTIKPDGTFQHHGMIYNGYNFPAIPPLVKLIKFLKNTPFESVKMHKATKKVITNILFYSGNAESSQLWGGRWRDGSSLSFALYDKFASCGNLGENHLLDRDLSPFLLYFMIRMNCLGNLNKACKSWLANKIADYKAKGISPVTSSDGHLTLNHAASAVHRRENWVFTVKGQKKGYNVNEIYGAQAAANSMGRYLSYGAYQVISKGLPARAAQSGYLWSKEYCHGWDFNFWPGTTVREIPYKALRSHFEVEEILTSEKFCGGCSLENYGLFAMKFREETPDWGDPRRLGPPTYWLGKKEFNKRLDDALYDTTFRWRKSVFFFDDYILFLGSNISTEDKAYRVCTVLLQNHLLPNNLNNFSCNGTNTPFPFKTKLEGENWMVDAYDNGYYVAGNSNIEIIRHHQDKPFYNSWNENDVAARMELTPNEGDIELAVINHGKAPENSDFEYALLVDAGVEKTKEFSKNIPYCVHQKDSAAHIVSDSKSGVTSYAIFDADKFKGFGELSSVSRPCLIMFRKEKICICDPDFGEYLDYSETGRSGTDIKLDFANGKSITIHCADGIPVELDMKKLFE